MFINVNQSEGTREVFFEGFPAFPDGISVNGKGNFWVALIAPRNKLLEFIHQFPFVKKLLLSVVYPDAFVKPASLGLVVEINPEGRIISCFYDKTGTIPSISSVTQCENVLLIGGLERDFLAIYNL